MMVKEDNRGKDPDWDLCYFSHNTGFCLESAQNYQTKISEQGTALKSFSIYSQDKINCSCNDVRRNFGSFSMFLYAALESFAHEINILYELSIERRLVGIKKISKKLDANCALYAHLHKLNSDKDIEFLFEYRNAFAHGYVFPISGTAKGFFLTKDPRSTLFAFNTSGGELISFAERVFELVKNMIKEGWVCFSQDQLAYDPDLDHK